MICRAFIRAAVALSLLAGGLSGCGAPAEQPTALVATYAKEARADAIRVQVADNGDARLDMRLAIVRVDGTIWMVPARPAGAKEWTPRAARHADVETALGEARARQLAAREAGPPDPNVVPADGIVTLPGGARVRVTRNDPPAAQWKIAQAGEETVAGRKGVIWRLTDASGARSGYEFVISGDPDLAIVGDLMRVYLTVTPPDDDPVTPFIASILKKGTLLRMSDYGVKDGKPWTRDRYRLTGITRAPLAPDAFALPEKRVSLDELRAEMAP